MVHDIDADAAGSSPPVRGTDFFYFFKIIEFFSTDKIHQH